MAGIPVVPPFPVFTDREGQPLDNGFVYIGVENLDPIANLISVFWDEALTIPADQPIRTINGYPSMSGSPAVVYAAVNYSITVKDSVGQLVYSSPSSPTSANGLQSDLADSSSVSLGDALVAVKQPWMGSVATTQHEVNSRTVNARDTGAVFDGVTVDDVGIQASIDYLATVGGGIVNLPPGVGIITKLKMKQGVWIRGAGVAATTLKAKPAMLSGDRLTDDGAGNNYGGCVMFYNEYPGAGSALDGICISDMTIDGNAANQVLNGAKNLWGIYLNKIQNFRLNNVIIKNCLNHGLCLKESTKAYITNSDFNTNGQTYLIPLWNPADGGNPGGDGAVILSQGYDNVISNCRAVGNGSIGIEDEGRFGAYDVARRNYRTIVSNCMARDNSDHNFLALWSSYAIFQNCISLGGGTNGFNIVGTDSCRFENIIVKSAGGHGIWVRPEIYGADGVNTRLTIHGATIMDSSGYGLRVEGANDSEFIGIKVRGVGGGHGISFITTPSTDCVLQGDYDGSYGTKANYGIYAYNPTRLTIRDSKSNNCAVYGFWIDGTAGGATGYRLVNSTATGNTNRGLGGVGGGVLTGYNNVVEGCNFNGNGVATSLADPQIAIRVDGELRTIMGTAAPVAGAWIVGDRCINSAPTVGQPKAWSCTVAGTPGTWVSEGNL